MKSSEKMKYLHFSCCLFLFFLVVLFSLTAKGFAGGEKITIYFYSSETNINNFKSLKMEFDSYLSKFGSYEFQPFSDPATFEKHIRGEKKCLLFLSSWHYNKIKNAYSLKPLLTGIRNGKEYQKRILVASSRYHNINDIKAGPVASSSNIPFTRSILKEMFNKKSTADSIRILKVPKDIDALMSVGFEMSKSALITESTLENLKNTDPVLYKKIKTLAVGKESLLLILAVPENFIKEAEKLTNLIQNMPKNPDGMDIIKMLDLDGWKTIKQLDNLKLEG